MQERATRTITKGVLSRSGWSQGEEALLKQKLSGAARTGTTLREVFEHVARETGRKPNSVRNYYYTAVRKSLAQSGETALVRRERSGFETFTQAEVQWLLETMLRQRAQGQSVRASALAMGGGDKGRMLRFQNKYRSLVKHKPELVLSVVEHMRLQGFKAYNPYAPSEVLKSTQSSAGNGSIVDELCDLAQVSRQELAQGIRALCALSQQPE